MNKITGFMEPMGGLVCLLVLLWPWNGMAGIIPSQMDIALRMQIALSIQLLIIGCLRLLKRDCVIRITRLDIVLGLYCVYLICRGGFSNVHFMELVTLVLIYLVFRSSEKSFILFYLAVIPVLGCFQLVYGFVEQSGFFSSPDFHLERMTGTFFNTGIWGGYIMLLLGISLTVVWLLPVNRKYKLFYALLSVFYVIALYFSDSRAAWLAALFFILYIVMCGRRLGSMMGLKQIGLILLASFSVLLIACICGEYKIDSMTGRLLIWIVSFYMLRTNLLFGLGINSFQGQYMEYQASFSRNHDLGEWGYLLDDTLFPFNELIRIGVEQGVVGVGIVCYILYLSTRDRDVSIDPGTQDMECFKLVRNLLIGWGIFSLFSYPFSVFQMFALLVVFVAIQARYRHVIYEINLSSRFWISLPSGVISFVVYLNLFWFVPYYSAFTDWGRIFREARFENGSVAIRELRQMSRLLSDEASFTLSLARQLYDNGQYDESLYFYEKSYSTRASYITLLEKAWVCIQVGRYQEAELSLQKAMCMIPNRIKPFYYRAVMFEEQGKYEDANSVLKEGLSKRIKVSSVHTDEVLNKMRELEKEICSNKIINLNY